MRIIAGKFKRQVIHTIRGEAVRPTTDRVRQALFDTLAARMNFEDIDVLDLFAGSGILGIEALSRGALRCTFVEQNRKTMQGLAQSIKLLQLEEQTQLVQTDALRFLEQTTAHYDLIFADPPYKFEHYHELLDKIFSRNLLAGYLAMEHHKRKDFSARAEFLFCKEFGTTVVSFFSAKQTS
ncbi:MAG: 16S rRNA (guanine(966)-N(2))-methyltransferase RsmD [[Chlorobium] sp. 445]|nr:MAG: 16S rRNA (guanine(966)-N(2))-methyltransferase RsmD [[Chlorobium] sp. 445]